MSDHSVTPQAAAAAGDGDSSLVQASAHQVIARAREYVHTLRTDPSRPWLYCLNRGNNSTIYASCFALYLHSHWGSLTDLPASARQGWADYLRSHQEPETGYFADPAATGAGLHEKHDAEHLKRQLTTFCLSALGELGVEPTYPLRFLEPWRDGDKLRAWLSSLDWRHNPWNSGNRAMFMAIFLTLDYQLQGNEASRDALEHWFEWHEARQRPKSGFWGETSASDYYQGLGGA